MKTRTLMLSLLLAVSAAAELPYFRNGEWRGYFAVHESQRYDFSVRNDGEMILTPKKRGREEVAKAKRIKLEYGIEELRPDGTTVFKQTRRGTLVSADEPEDDIRKLVYRGTATGEAVYEVTIEQSRDVISIGGRVVEKGELTEHPLRFTVRAHIPNVYDRVDIDDRDDERDFDRLTRRDYLEVVRADHSKQMLSNDDEGVLDGDQITGSGIEEIEMRLSYYEGRRFFFAASRNSGIAISNDRRPGPWYEGMTLHWISDDTLDPEHKARFSFYIK